LRKLIDFFSTATAVIALMVVPPLGGILSYGLWLRLPLEHIEIPALLAGTWTAIVLASLIKQGLE